MSISTFYENKIFRFPCCRLLHYLLLWDLYWRNNRHFSTNLYWRNNKHFSTSQDRNHNSISSFFLLKKINFMGFHAVVLLKIFPFMYHYFCKSNIDKARIISFFRSNSAQIKIQFTLLKKNINYYCKSNIDEARRIYRQTGFRNPPPNFFRVDGQSQRAFPGWQGCISNAMITYRGNINFFAYLLR